jgi:hypothetical protein
MPAALCLVALLALVVATKRPSTVAVVRAPTATMSALPVDGAALPTGGDESSWMLITDMAADLDWDGAIEAGLAAPAGAVDRAVFDLSADERRELQRLLNEELSRSGA